MADNRLRVLLVTQYFWPENMRINDMVRYFTEQGHEVTVLTGLPNYPEGEVFEAYREKPEYFKEFQGAEIIRVPLVPRGSGKLTLALNYLSFFISASTVGAYKLKGRQFDAIFMNAVSPIMAAIPAIVIGRLKRTPVFVWVLDLWPESLSFVGVVKNPKLIAMVGKVVSWIYNRTDYLLVQSHAFVEDVKRYCTKRMPDERLIYFPSWAEDDFSASVSPQSSLIDRQADVFTIVYAGNLGETQGFPSILDAAEELRDQAAIRWVIVGDGRMGNWIAEQIALRQLDNVLLLGRHPLEEMPALFAQADALLVSLKTNDIIAKTIPGKVQTYLASGRPLIGAVDGEAARVIRESGAGLACPSGDGKALSRIVLELASADVEKRNEMGRSGRLYYEQNFSRTKLMKKLEALMYAATLRRGAPS
ncbi:glycosyltransferase family 4 protein [Pseudomonas putida]|uniref:Glycosyltransferase family 4 protein n=1 Tax=Pseudomonas putida TaxID=303 RepID=A0AAW5HP90_PSEPU|nr:glycosyltransferase family 4 protein [Pseudomonas putida]MCO1624114.1 glycosyltransferase family 4 protein [Pseudomonas putida]